ncbi:MAG: PSD1 and planctomycete cytochrome C domain-containing protein [Planctomycetota bacterium]|nr:PSD1 and planctomycete cytochrome C domain-containing protein [Planctomycetota bacterium]
MVPWFARLIRVEFLAIVGWALALASTSMAAADDSLFKDLVAPILAQRCLECHNSLSPEGGLDLSTPEAVFGHDPTLIVRGDAESSQLWQRVAQDEMPPEHPLPASEKESLRKWITAGATWEGGPIDPFRYSSAERAGYDWWSLQPQDDEIAVPPVGLSGAHPIDRFVDQKLVEKGLQPAGRADPRTLVRRLYNDLVGLPPTYAEVVRFSKEPSDTAWAAMVDQLLASPEFGERWAQHWLDIARFGESDGFEYNQPREQTWHYRDWVIRAFNQDLPYDQFARMQLAGDVIEGPTMDGLAAIGFLVAGVHNPVLGQSEAMRANARHAELEEIAATTSQAFLGLTLHCARCHDHKYDPISTEDYYRFIAALDGVRHGSRVAQSGDAAAEAIFAAKRSELREMLQEQQAQRGAILSRTGNALVSRDSFAINARDQVYSIRLAVSPTVWEHPAQATSVADGIRIRLVRPDDSVAQQFSAQPGSWHEAGSQAKFVPFEFKYVGDGSGDLRIRLESLKHEGRFGGAIDDLSIHAANGTELLTESFDELLDLERSGIQADTSATIYFGTTSVRWEHLGINAIHALQVAPGQFAVQLFGGSLDAVVEPKSEVEIQLQRQLDALPSSPSGVAVYTVAPGPAKAMHVMRRGDPMQPLKVVVPGAPKSIIGPDADWNMATDAEDADRRLGLARWMTDRRNGPFHRTAVNRCWHLLLGRGLVATPSDLGFQGGKPSHPELLEWLASDFRATGLSLKRLIRKIVLSETYRRSSRAEPAAITPGEAVDRDAVWLWRRQPQRLQAEVIRDSMLAITGALSPARFGPGYRDVVIETVGAAHYYGPLDVEGSEFDRRTIYRWRHRGERHSLLEAFDCPDPSIAAPERIVTTTPTQSLSLWNHQFVLRMSRELAAQVIEDVGDDPAEQVSSVWRRVLLREATTAEQIAARELVLEFGLASLCRVLFNTSESVTLD